MRKAGSGGTHLTGGYPGDATGTPAAGDSTGPAAWTVSVHVGGSPSPDPCTDVWALCLDTRHGPGNEGRPRP